MNDFFQNGFTFVDLFAGIGGFHQAMKKLNGRCVFAAEFSEETAKTYKNNYGIEAFYDVTKIDPNIIPKHDVLCAGFPCQSFSKAGYQKGFYDARGVLFYDIIRILKNHIDRYGGPKFLLLENVRHLVGHDKGRTWGAIREELVKIGYNVIETPAVVSPHYFGIPQLRDRAIIVAVKNSIYSKKIELSIPKRTKNTCNMDSILASSNDHEYNQNEFKISKYEEKVLDAWDQFIKGINRKILGFPIWSDDFFREREISGFPVWKQNIIQKNRQLYAENKEFIDEWYLSNNNLITFKKTHRKFEWQVNDNIKSVYDGIIQFRTSGIRVKQPTEFPALVAMVHVPIVGKYKRYLTPREVANLQSFPLDFKIDDNIRLAYKQFGNAVNVDVIYNVFKEFVEFIEKEGVQ